MQIGQLAFGAPVVGQGATSVTPSLSAPSPYSSLQAERVIQSFSERLRNLEQAIVKKVDGGRVLSAIALTSDTALISSDKIALVGEVTFADWQRDVSGQATGAIDPSITQIRGGVIRTGKVVSMDGLSWLDLDTTSNAAPFLKCRNSALINPDGTFVFGGGSSNALIYDGARLTLGDTVLLGSTAVSTVVSNASYGPSAYSTAITKLNKAGGDILSGAINVQSGGGFVAGTLTWDSSGNRTGGYGTAMTQKGILAYNAAGTPTFALSAVSGEITAASFNASSAITLSSINTSNVETSQTAPINFYRNSSIAGSIYSLSTNISMGSGIGYKSGTMIDTGSDGKAFVLGKLSVSDLYVENGSGSGKTASGVGNGSGQIPLSNGAANLNLYASWADSCWKLFAQNWGSDYLMLQASPIGTGSATATFAGNNKPGGASTNTWVKFNINGTIYYLPAWT